MHVYCSDGDIWDCMLNQTYMQNNNNKYYIIQLLESDLLDKYVVWTRWGRVGKAGQTADYPTGSRLEEAKWFFCTKFKDKTENNWHTRKKFTKVSGKYSLLEMDYDATTAGADTNAIDSAKAEPSDAPDCKLDQRVQDLITLIADVDAMEAVVVEMQYDAKKAPLGKLTKAQIKQGYSALKDIETLIKAGKFGSELTEACNAFYTRIPHDFGMKPPERIVSLDTLKAKIDLLEALGDIEIAVNVLKKGDQSIHPIDRMYLSLECDLEPMDKSCDIYKLLQSYLLNTHGSTHNHYSIKLLDIFHCYKDQPSGPDVGNKMLLWHGSRLTNWVRILAKGLRIAPPEAPVTGYVFGKGVYFADCSSKSANYCFPTKMKNVGLLLLNEVTLGQQNELVSSNYHANKLPKGKHSVKGCGKMAPSQEGNTDLDGVTVPCGRLKETGIVNSSGYTLQYHEYIVYNTNQIKMKYLLKVKFNFHH
ncbi:poly [ADP-ribose] polymerase 2-like [Watersipora subatra]|uniref:poly [ADP-ribose] polymerase 2-like n=1 Tax=Watersipora subatra TaxID=2589382 RepID=UPI00355B61E3